jgi:hypothetical protein
MDDQVTIHNTPSGIRDAFAQHIGNKFQHIQADAQAMQNLLRAVHPTDPSTHADTLERAISMDELKWAVLTGAKHRSPWIDGMNLEFYTTNWETVQTELLALVNHMFQRKHLSRKQKQGIIVNLPKCNFPKRTSDYRPITLLTTEYKILARIMAQRLKLVLADHLRDTQYCGVMGIDN